MNIEQRARVCDGGDTALARTGGWLLAVGSFSVVCTSLFYLLSPPAAVAPVLAPPADAMAAAAAGAATMRVAGTCGVFGNLVMAIGAVLLTIESAAAGRTRQAAGWAAMVMSIGVFEIVDCLTGFVLSTTARGGDAVAFEAFRGIFATYFLVGTAFFGVGAILVLVDVAGTTAMRWLARVGLFNGLMGATSVALTVAGLPLPQLVGASVGVGAILFVPVGIAVARGAIGEGSAAGRMVVAR